MSNISITNDDMAVVKMQDALSGIQPTPQLENAWRDLQNKLNFYRRQLHQALRYGGGEADVGKVL